MQAVARIPVREAVAYVRVGAGWWEGQPSGLIVEVDRRDSLQSGWVGKRRRQHRPGPSDLIGGGQRCLSGGGQGGSSTSIRSSAVTTTAKVPHGRGQQWYLGSGTRSGLECRRESHHPRNGV